VLFQIELLAYDMREGQGAAPPAGLYHGLAGFAVQGVFAAARAILPQFQPRRVVSPILLSSIVAFLALGAGQRNYDADTFFLSHTTPFTPGSR
jgi:hypothetical protein